MTTPAPKSNLVAGVVAAVAGALAGAVLWAVLVSVTDVKIGYAAVGVGALTGLLAGRTGGGHPQLPAIAAGIGVLGCLVGDLLIEAHAGAKALNLSSFTLLTEYRSEVWAAYKYDFDVLSGLFYVFAGVAAFRLAAQHGSLHKQPPAAQAWPPPAPTGEPAPYAPPVQEQEPVADEKP